MACQTSDFASSNRVRVAYDLEDSFGVPNTPLDMTILRVTSATPIPDKQTAISEEIRSDRMTAGISEVGFQSGGDLGIEMNLGGTYDDWLEVALSGQWSTPISFTGSLEITAATRTISDPGIGGTAFTNAAAGQWVYLQGFVNAANNGWWKIETVTDADNIIVEDPATALVDETGPVTNTAQGKTLINGTCENSFTVELGFMDIMAFILYAGQRPNWSISVSAGAIVTGAFTVMGTAVSAQETTPYGDSYADAPVTTPLNATSNVGQVTKNGVELTTAVQAFEVNVDNSYRSDLAVKNKYPVSVGYGTQVISGTLTAYFQDLTLSKNMLDHDKVSFAFDFTDLDGHAMHVEIPAIHFLTSDPGADGRDTTVLENLDWQAVPDDTGTYQIRIDMVTQP